VVKIVDPHEDWEQCPRGYPFGIQPPAAGVEGCENRADLAEHARHRGTRPGKIVGLHEAVVVLRCHVHDEVGPVAGGVAFVGAGVAERVVWARLGSVLPVEAGGGIGCAALRDVSISTGGDGLDAKSLQGKHPFHFRKSLPVAIAGTEHSGVVGSSAGAILKGEEDGQGNVGKECIVHSGKDSLVGEDRSGRAGNSKSSM